MRTLMLIVAATTIVSAQDYPHAFPRTGVKQLVDHERFTLWEVHWKLNTPQPYHRHKYDMAGVYLRFGKIAVTTPDGRVNIGAPFDVPRPYFQLKDVTHKEEAVGAAGDPERLAFMVDLKDVAAPPLAVKPATVAAFPREGAKDVLDNARVRMWDYTWQPGKPVAQHLHDTDSIVVFVTGGTMKTRLASGREETHDIAAQSAVYAPRGQIDSEEAIGNPIRAIVIELK